MDELELLNVEEARLNITWRAQNGDLVDPIPFDVDDRTIKTLAAEAVRAGDVAGISADESADFSDFVVDRYPASGDINYNRVFLRPKTPFGF